MVYLSIYLIRTNISYDLIIDESGGLYAISRRYGQIVSRVISGCIFMVGLKRLQCTLIFMVSSLNSLKTDDVSHG